MLIIANAVFSMSEIALFAARKPRLQQRAQEGDERAAAALALANSPDDFLSTVQVGVTLVGVLAGAFGGATIARPLAAALGQIPALARYREALAIGLVVVAITYLTLIFGELVPKRIALRDPEGIASAMARPMRFLSRATLPVVRVLSGSTSLVLRLLGTRQATGPPVTEEEIKLLIGQGTQAGMFEAAEQKMVERVFRLGDRRVGSLMTPRTKIVWLDAGDSPAAIAGKISVSPYSRFPVGRGQLDNCLGYVRVKDLLDGAVAATPIDLLSALRQPLVAPETMRALVLLERFKTTGTHFAIVVDEYGGIEGLVTPNDVLEAIVGEMQPAGEGEEAPAIEREDGSWLVDGAMLVDDLRELVAMPKLPAEQKGAFKTLGGFVMSHLGRVARTGDHFEIEGVRFEVVDMDGHQIDKVLIAPHHVKEA
ncbi:MAG: hemolysin family protein [Acidobacteriota bacterium]